MTDNSELGALALFGRNELARKDEYVSLEKSFLFVGNDVNTGVSLGRMDDLSDEVGSRTLSVNLAGLCLPTALKSLARSINMQVYMSPAVNAAPQKVSLDISRADALDIFDILIDNYGLAMAYDRKMGVARFYTRAEFSERVDDAVAAAELHNRRARNLRKISSLENDTAALRQIYQNYFQHPDDAGRVRSLTNDAIIEDDHSPAVASAIVAFKEAALQNERDLDALDLQHATDRQEQATKTQTAQFELEDVNKALALRHLTAPLNNIYSMMLSWALQPTPRPKPQPACRPIQLALSMRRRAIRRNRRISLICPMPKNCVAVWCAMPI